MIVVIITQFLVLSLSRIVFCKPFQSEPMCSRYYYEEKLLTKTIKLEYAVEEVVKNKNEMEAKFTEELEKMAGKFKQLDAVVMKMDNKTEAGKSKVIRGFLDRLSDRCLSVRLSVLFKINFVFVL